jgi:hypothetical protein
MENGQENGHCGKRSPVDAPLKEDFIETPHKKRSGQQKEKSLDSMQKIGIKIY